MNDHTSLQKQIINYWDNAGIFSFDSSTCAGDKNLAACTNFVESTLLDNILKRHNYSGGKGIGMDIGAGLGRFTAVLARNLDSVYALEPAANIYNGLVTNCAGLNNVKTFQVDFESFNNKEKFDIAVISGVLYLYTDEMVNNVLKKFGEYSKTGSEIIIRDFIIKNGIQNIPSSYISGGFCYYRDRSYWKKTAGENGYELIEVFQAKPSYPVSIMMWFLRKSGLVRLFNLAVVKRIMYGKTESKRIKGTLDFLNSSILTVFMVMRKQ